MSNCNIFFEQVNTEDIKSELLKKLLSKDRAFIFKTDQEQLLFHKKVSDAFNVNPDDVYLVGSAKLGFSTNSSKDFDQEFKKTGLLSQKSDLDIAIVSAELFIRIMKDCWKLTSYYKNHDKWTQRKPEFHCIKCKHPSISSLSVTGISLKGIVCERHVQNNKPWNSLYLSNDKISFYEYLAKGWFRKDLAPREFSFGAGDDTLRELKKQYDRKVSVAVYADLEFLSDFQLQGITKLVQNRKAE